MSATKLKLKEQKVCSSCSHEWTAEPHRRYVRDSGCPKCATEQQVKNMLRARGLKKRKIV